MNELERLNERITQLTELVKNGSEAIKSMKAVLEAAEKERDRLADQRREKEPKFERVEHEERYYGVCVNSEVDSRIYNEVGNMRDGAHFRNNNYFHTKQRAKEVADKIRFLLKLERLHDVYCPDYVPDWSGKEWKYYVSYENTCKHYKVCSSTSTEQKANVYFPTREIVQKVCDILDAELEEKK